MAKWWYRLEGSSRAIDLEPGLQARIADPMWLLARQWQVGEFRGEDAASPVYVRMMVRSTRVRSLRRGPGPGGLTTPLPPAAPLEPLVEADAITTGAPALREAADAGLHFLRLMDQHGAGALRGKVQPNFAFPPADVDAQRSPAARLLIGRSPDGRALYAARTTLDTALGETEVPPDLQTAMGMARDHWVEWYEVRFVEPDTGSAASWLPERMAYAFSVAAPLGPDSEITLRADDYTGEALDWYAFDVETRSAYRHGVEGEVPPARQAHVIPTPVRYSGMPASRWWAFEDGETHFGDLAAGPADLARLAVAEFAMVFSDNWHVVPIVVPVGSLTRVNSLKVLDTFGVVHNIEPIAVDDGPNRVWRFFEITGDTSPEDGHAPWLYVPATVHEGLRSRPVEAVAFLRDENANLGWAIETRYESPAGIVVRRGDVESAAEAPDAPPEEPPSPDEPWSYLLATTIPPHWFPLLPQRAGEASPAMQLRRGRMAEWEQLPPGRVGIRGRLLVPDAPLVLNEETLPRGGLTVTRLYQLARGSNGALRLWAGRLRQPGHGERSSSRETDQIE